MILSSELLVRMDGDLVFLTPQNDPRVRVCSTRTIVPILKEFVDLNPSSMNILSVQEQMMFLMRTIMKIFGVSEFNYSFYQIEKDHKVYDILGKKYIRIFESMEGGIDVLDCTTISSSRLNDLYKLLKFNHCEGSVVRVLTVQYMTHRLRFFDVSVNIPFPTPLLMQRFEQFLSHSCASLIHKSYLPFFRSCITTPPRVTVIRDQVVESVEDSPMVRDALVTKSKLYFTKGNIRIDYDCFEEMRRILKHSNLEIERLKKIVSQQSQTIDDLRTKLKSSSSSRSKSKKNEPSLILSSSLKGKNNKKRSKLLLSLPGNNNNNHDKNKSTTNNFVPQSKKKKKRKVNSSSSNLSSSIIPIGTNNNNNSNNKPRKATKKKKGRSNIIRKKKRTSGNKNSTTNNMNSFNYALEFGRYEDMMRSLEVENKQNRRVSKKSKSNNAVVDWKRSFRDMSIENKLLKKRIYDLEISKSEVINENKEMILRHDQIRNRLEEDLTILRKKQEDEGKYHDQTRNKYEEEMGLIKNEILELVNSHRKETDVLKLQIEESNRRKIDEKNILESKLKESEEDVERIKLEQAQQVEMFNQMMQEKHEEMERLEQRQEEIVHESEKSNKVVQEKNMKLKLKLKTLTHNLTISKEKQKKVKNLLKDLLNHLEISENKNRRNEEEVITLREKLSNSQNDVNRQKRMLKDCSNLIKKYQEKNKMMKLDLAEKLRSTFEKERENSQFVKILNFHIKKKKSLSFIDLQKLLAKSREKLMMENKNIGEEEDEDEDGTLKKELSTPSKTKNKMRKRKSSNRKSNKKN